MSEPDAPRSRGWWWKLSLAAFAVLLLIAFVAHAIWTARERAAVAQRVAAIRARGEPIDVSDLAEPTVPDAENAAVAIRAAAAVIASHESSENDKRHGAIELDDLSAFHAPLTLIEREALRATVAENDAALRAIDLLDTSKGVAWHDAATPGIPRRFRLTTDLNESRSVSLLLIDAARLAADDGDTKLVFRRLAQMDAVAQAVAEKQFFVATLVANGIEWSAAHITIELTPKLAGDSAARADVLSWAAKLSDDRPIRAIWRRGQLGQRVELQELAQYQVGHPGQLVEAGASTLFGRAIGKLLEPEIRANAAAILDVQAAELSLVDRSSLSDIRAHSAPLDASRRAAASRPIAFAQALLGPSDRAMKIRCEVLTTRHLAAVAVALRLYRSDHDGALPPTLESLTPTYLPHVPIDAIDGKMIRYDRDRAIIWSIGENESDNGGDEMLIRAEDDRDLWTMKDAVVHLTPQPRPATRPGE